jgi:WD40 repeat protein
MSGNGKNYLAVYNGNGGAELRDGCNPDDIMKSIPDVDEYYFNFRYLCFDATGMFLAAVAGCCNVHVFDVESSSLVGSITEENDAVVTTVSFHPVDNNFVLTRNKLGIVRLWEWRSQQQCWNVNIATVSMHLSSPCACFSVDGQQIIANADFNSRPSDLAVLDAANGNLLSTLHGHAGSIESLSVSPVGDCIASGTKEGTVTVWDLLTVSPIYIWPGFDSPFSPGQKSNLDLVLFFPDGSKLAIAVHGGIVILAEGTWAQLHFIRCYYLDFLERSLSSLSINALGNRIAWTYRSSFRFVVYDLDAMAEMYSAWFGMQWCCCCFSPAEKVILM